MIAIITLKIESYFEAEEIDCLRDNLSDNHPRSIRSEHQLIDLIKGVIDYENTDACVDSINDSVSPKWPGGLAPVLEMTPAEQWDMGLKP